VDAFFENAPEMLTAAAKSPLGILGLMVIVVAFVVIYLFRNDHVLYKLLALCLLLAGIAVYGYVVLQMYPFDSLGQPQGNTPQTQAFDKPVVSNPIPKSGELCNVNNPPLECLWIK
jgi:hypothetical protein